MRRLARLVGCQQSSADNQAEHLQSLLLSYLGRCDGDVNQAIFAMHSAVLQSYQRWRLHISRGGERGSTFDSGVLTVWDRRSPAEQMEEVALFLLVWGEAGAISAVSMQSLSRRRV